MTRMLIHKGRSRELGHCQDPQLSSARAVAAQEASPALDNVDLMAEHREPPIFSLPLQRLCKGGEETRGCCKEGICTAGNGRVGAAPSHCLPMSLLPTVVAASSSFSIPMPPPVHAHRPHSPCCMPSSAVQTPSGDGDLSGDISLPAGPNDQLRKPLVQSVSRKKGRDILWFITNLFMSQFSAIGSSITCANPSTPLTQCPRIRAGKCRQRLQNVPSLCRQPLPCPSSVQAPGLPRQAEC